MIGFSIVYWDHFLIVNDAEIHGEANLFKISNTFEPTRRAAGFDHPQKLSGMKNQSINQIYKNLVTSEKAKLPKDNVEYVHRKKIRSRTFFARTFL